MRSKVSRNFVLLAPPSCGEVSANKSANVGALIFIVTLFCSVLIIAYHPPFVQRFPKTDLENKRMGKETSIERTQRLFYVTCTRAKKSLAVVMYTSDVATVKENAIRQLPAWIFLKLM